MTNFILHTQTLELDKVLKMLASRAQLEDAKTAALSLLPKTDVHFVKRLLSETDDAYRLIAGFGSPSFGNAKNIKRPEAPTE